jgi:hypothetical protein
VSAHEALEREVVVLERVAGNPPAAAELLRGVLRVEPSWDFGSTISASCPFVYCGFPASTAPAPSAVAASATSSAGTIRMEATLAEACGNRLAAPE